MAVMSKRLPARLIAARILELDKWLESEAPYARFDQCHLDADTPERAYWHLGYQAALVDILTLLSDDVEGNIDRPSRLPGVDQDD